MQEHSLSFLFLVLASAASSPGAQSTWHVDDDAPGDPSKGNPLLHDPLEDGSVAHPFDRLSAAIAAASSGDTILVAPSNPEWTGLHYWEIDSIDLSGAGGPKTLTVRGTGGAEVTVLQGVEGILVPLLQALQGETSAYVLEGITLRAADNGSTPADTGGGVEIRNSDPTFRDCIFEDGHAYIGGGAYLHDSFSLFEDCAFDGNGAVHQGGAVYTNDSSPTFSRCTFTLNTANFGGAVLIRTISSGAPRFLDCLFHQNAALVGYAGGLAKFDGGTVTVERTLFVANVAVTTGGGMTGGGMHVSGGGSVWDCAFNSNEGSSGGGLYSINSGTCTVHGSTFTNNSNGGASEGGGGQLVLVNCIVWDNVSFELGAGAAVSYSDVLGGHAGTGNLNSDPLFEDPWGLDGQRGTLDDRLALMEESPCIDAGNALPLATRTPHVGYPQDLARKARVVQHDGTPDTGIAVLGLAVDLGALEFQPAKAFARRHTLP